MELIELENLKQCQTEEELRKIAEEIGDKVSFRGYTQNQVITLVAELMKLDLQSFEYATREEILNVLCDCTLYYDIRNAIKLDKLKCIKGQVEQDLEEYIEEILGN